MLELLSVDGMSLEEEDTRSVSDRTVTVYLVKLCIWRADEITQYLKIIDRGAENPALHQHRGSRACPRIPCDEQGITVPSGLPRKMYSLQWLGEIEVNRPNYVEDVLQVSEEAF